MPKESDELKEQTQEEIEAEEKFRNFFSNSVAQIPQAMKSTQPEKKAGLFSRIFNKADEPAAAPQRTTAPTGEIMLEEQQAVPDADLALAQPTPTLEEFSQALEGLDKPDEPKSISPALDAEEEEMDIPLTAITPDAELSISPALPQSEEQLPEPTAIATEEKPVDISAAVPEDMSLKIESNEPEAETELPPIAVSFASDVTIQDTPAEKETVKADDTLTQETVTAPVAAAAVAAAAKPKNEKHSSRKKNKKKNSRPMSEEDKELLELKAMLDTIGSGQGIPAPKPAVEEVQSMGEQELLELKAMLDNASGSKAGKKQANTKAAESPKASKSADKPAEEFQAVSGFHFFGTGEDEAPHGIQAEATRSIEDTMSIELHEAEPVPAATEPAEELQPPETAETAAQEAAPEKDAPEANSAPEEQAEETAENADAASEESAEDTPEEAEQQKPQTSEEVGETLRQTIAGMNLRCVLSGILAVALIWLGLMSEELLPPTAALDPIAAPTAFMGANLLLLLAALAVSYNILRDGLRGLVGEPSLDTMPALAAAGALVEAVVALMSANAYQSSSFKLMSGTAALLLFLDHLGNRLLAVSVREGQQIVSSGVEHRGAYRAKDKDLVRCLAGALEEKDPWILLSRPTEWVDNFIEKSFSTRACERSAQKLSRILLGCAALSALVMLLMGKGIQGAAAALAAILCMGAPFSSTLIVGLTSLRMERSAGAVGAVIPGWASIEELGGIDTIQVDAGDLFTPECVQLEDIRIFKGGRIDRAILYAASVLNQGCNTLSGLFRQIIEDRTDILPPVKDLERKVGLGFTAWCDNNHIVIGTRQMLEQEGIPLPEQEYEDKHSKNGELQILYLAVSGNIYAMFVLRYVGGKNAAHGLAILQKENIRLLVTCEDPTLTAEKITAAYHLPEGLVMVLDQQQCDALAPAVSYASEVPCCMVHLKGLASLTGGLRAAEQAQNAEITGTTVQKVSIWFSIIIGLLLTYAGSIGTLSLAVVLMYQAAWSALSIAAAAMKQHT